MYYVNILFNRYGKIQSVRLPNFQKQLESGSHQLINNNTSTTTGQTVSTAAACVAFMDIKSAAKAHICIDHSLDGRILLTGYTEPNSSISQTSTLSEFVGYVYERNTITLSNIHVVYSFL